MEWEITFFNEPNFVTSRALGGEMRQALYERNSGSKEIFDWVRHVHHEEVPQR